MQTINFWDLILYLYPEQKLNHTDLDILGILGPRYGISLTKISELSPMSNPLRNLYDSWTLRIYSNLSVFITFMIFI